MNKQIKAGADIHAGDGGYSEGTQEQYEAFVKVRNKSLAQGRIRDLAEQAGFKTNWQHEDVQAIKMARFEKFAELIVRECEKSIKSVPTHFEAQDKIIVECLKSIREIFRS
jgi:hypothetical protein